MHFKGNRSRLQIQHPHISSSPFSDSNPDAPPLNGFLAFAAASVRKRFSPPLRPVGHLGRFGRFGWVLSAENQSHPIESSGWQKKWASRKTSHLSLDACTHNGLVCLLYCPYAVCVCSGLQGNVVISTPPFVMNHKDSEDGAPMPHPSNLLRLVGCSAFQR